VLEYGVRSRNFYELPIGPNNPVGVMWIGLNRPGIGIHGTNSPQSIGRSSSHGCMRTANWDVVRLVKLITQGIREGMRTDKPVRIDVGGDWATSAALVLDAVGKGDLVLLQPDTIEQAMPWLAERYGNRLKEAVLDEIAGTAPPAADTAPVVAKADEAVPAPANRPT
jgi:hypothetical protein